MGIAGFYKFIKKRYIKATAPIKLSGSQIDRLVYGLYIDLNGLLHRCRLIVYGSDGGNDLDEDLMELFKENHLGIDKNAKIRAEVVAKKSEQSLLDDYEAVFSVLLLSIVNAYSPLYELGLFVDGCVPSSKNQQQRRRREKSAMERATNLKYSQFDGAQISPATPWMFWMDGVIQRWVKRNLDKNFVPDTNIYSSHLQQGEGEHKIMDHFRSIYRDFKDKNDNYNNTYVVYGLDSDLIILSSLQKLRGIVLVREDADDVLDINTFKEQLIEDLGTPHAVDDFSVMMCLLGNDFLPERLGVQKTEELEHFYKIYQGLVAGNSEFRLTTPSGHLDYDGMEKFFEQLNGYERLVKYNKMARHDNDTESVIYQAIIDVKGVKQFNYQKYRELWYAYVFKSRGESRLSDYMFNKDHVFNKKGELSFEEDIKDMSRDYLHGIEWVYRYYTRGHASVSQTWFYPHYCPPLYSDMYAYIRDNNNPKFDVKYRDIGGFTVLHQLLMIIPKSSTQAILPPQLMPIVDGTLSNVNYVDLFPDRVQTDGNGLNLNGFRGDTRKHLEIVFAPFVDRKRIQEAVSKVLSKFAYSELLIYVEQEEKIYTNEKAEQRRRLLKKRIVKQPFEVRKEEFLLGSVFSGNGKDESKMIEGTRKSPTQIKQERQKGEDARLLAEFAGTKSPQKGKQRRREGDHIFNYFDFSKAIPVM